MDDYNSIPFRNRDIDKLKKKHKKHRRKQDKTLAKYSKATDEGNLKKANRMEKKAVKEAKKVFDYTRKKLDSM